MLRRPPRSPQESVLGGLLASVLTGGLVVATVVLAAGLVAPQAGRPWQSVMFVVLGLAQLGIALAVRTKAAPGTARNWALPAAVAVSAVLQVAPAFSSDRCKPCSAPSR